MNCPVWSSCTHLGKYVESGNRNCTKLREIKVLCCILRAQDMRSVAAQLPLLKMFVQKFVCLASLAAAIAAHFVVPNDDQDMSGIVVNGIPSSVREKYMRLVSRVSPPPLLAVSLIVTRPTKPYTSKVGPVPSPLMVPSL
jgi:hypothetical protein